MSRSRSGGFSIRRSSRAARARIAISPPSTSSTATRSSFHLRAPSASFPINLVMGIVPEGTGAAAARQPVGSGPYRLAEFVPDDHVTLAAVRAATTGGAPTNAGLVFQGRARRDDARAGAAQGQRRSRRQRPVAGSGRTASRTSRSLHGRRRRRAPTTPTSGSTCAIRCSPIARVRQAIGYAIDRDAIVTYLRRGLARPATGIVPSMSWAYAPDVLRFTHDPDKARALLDEAGLPRS